MDTVISMVSDLTVILFDLLLYMQLTLLKKETKLYYGLMYGGSLLVAVAYVLAAYVFRVPYAAASFLCMTIPSFLLFLCLAKYKSARFLVTFCFVDTVTFIIASLGKLVLVLGGTLSGLVSCIVLVVLSVGTYLCVRPYSARYRELLDRVSTGWAPMAFSTVLIYILLIGFTSYPGPLLSRLEYLPLYFILCTTVLSFYGVFIVLLTQKAKLTQANLLLKQQQHWHDLAYLDELTKLANPAAYVARTTELEKAPAPRGGYCIMIFDIDDFKNVNDTYGHLAGNAVLKKTASFFLATFSREHYEFFRVGGDEFAAIVTGLPRNEVEKQVRKINTMPLNQELGCTCSCGCAEVDLSRKKPFEEAFIQADHAMYTVKTQKKALKNNS